VPLKQCEHSVTSDMSAGLVVRRFTCPQLHAIPKARVKVRVRFRFSGAICVNK